MEVSSSDIPDSARHLKLDLWLFESLWQSDSTLSEDIKSETYYQMIRWPQPLSKSRRSQALRLAASSQHSPINAKILQEKTHYDLDLIRKFLYATENAGQAKAISEKEADNVTTNKVAVKQENKEIVEQKKGLLSRLRKTLGF
ncbi:hypothetical protein [Rappaport israeli]|uniref:hypothetical protein n=1 Tax=Rappaport israeli TaxID=1839807 RepID=UPI000AC9F8C3|nr:hypothetical protein [Rappaport israeli]